MKFTAPVVLNEMPPKDYFKLKYGPGFPVFITKSVYKKVYTRTRLAEAQNWRCCWCGQGVIPEPNKKNSATIEHIIPKSQGGSDDMSNLAVACSSCNNKRGVQDVETFFRRFACA